MTINQEYLKQIFAKASYLSERLSNDFLKADSTQLNQEQVNKRMKHWCQVVTQGNWEKFQKRLQWDGWDIDVVRSALEDCSIADIQTLPPWVETLREIIQTASEPIFQHKPTDIGKISNLKYETPIDLKNPLPFEDVLLPAILVARQKLLIYLRKLSFSPDNTLLDMLTEKAYLSMEHNLLQKLADLSSKTLEFEFSHFRPFGQNLLNSLEKKIEDTSSKKYYNSFVQDLLGDGLLTFFDKYPVLARLIATSVEFWVEAIATFLQDLDSDVLEINKVFNCCEQLNEDKNNIKNELGKVIQIKPGLSDYHNQNRSVIALTFESGLKLIYKPKTLALEIAYNQFLDWCNQCSIPLSFKVLKIINCDTHGWVEYVEHLPCDDEAAVKRFYKRSGMLLCILYVLGGTDCHYENLIANGEHLVLIDSETVIHHEANIFTDSPEATQANIAAVENFSDSVLRSGLLPRWELRKDNETVYDISGLRSFDPKQTSQRVKRWKSINTDDMRLGYESVPISTQQNTPILNGIVLSANDYVDELIDGFEQMYCFLMKQREALLGNEGYLAIFQTQQVRFLFRSTQVYFVVLQKTLVPELLRNGVDRSIELDILSRAFLTVKEKPNTWPILQAELNSIQQLDIPYFGAFSNSDVLTRGLEQPIKNYFKEPSYNKAILRLKQLNKTDLFQQVSLIKGAFCARSAHSPQVNKTPNYYSFNNHVVTDLSQTIPLTREQLLLNAKIIATEIQERAICGTDGSVNWIGLGYLANAERYQLQIIGESLYDGNCGIALFLAALTSVTHSVQLRNLALGALQSLRRILQTSDSDFSQRFALQIGIGGGVGLGSLIYSLVKISQFLNETSLLEDALQTANLVTSESIASDRKLDITHGVAGTILGLLTLYSQTGNLGVLNKAIVCGQHLLKHCFRVDNYVKYWTTFEKKPLTGLAHGAAGIACALLRLYTVTQEKVYLEAACEGIAYETNVFSANAANWPDFRGVSTNGQPRFNVVNWCNGAPGIGLARLSSLPILKTKEIFQDIEVALQTTQKYGLQGVDFLCCGNFGRIELLLVAAQKLSRPHLLESANKQAAWIVTQAEKIGTYQLFPNLPSYEFGAFSPSFFRGTAGIGYQLLRLAYPEILPSVLLWE